MGNRQRPDHTQAHPCTASPTQLERRCLGVAEGLADGLSVALGLGVGVDEGVAEGVAEGLAVGLGVGDGDTDGVPLGVAVGLLVGVDEGLALGVALDVRVSPRAMPQPAGTHPAPTPMHPHLPASLPPRRLPPCRCHALHPPPKHSSAARPLP